MSKRDEFGETGAAQELNDEQDSIAAIRKSVELGIRSILFYAVELQGLRNDGTSSIGKVENDELEYEVLVKCTRKRKIVLLGE